MGKPRSIQTDLLRLCGTFALGAAVTTGAQAAQTGSGRIDPSGSVSLRTEGGRIFMSERGQPFEELHLAPGPERKELLRYLARLSSGGSAVTVPTNRTIVADGGVGRHMSPPAEKKRKRTAQSGT